MTLPRALPPALRAVVVPDQFGPTAIAKAAQCPLQAALAAHRVPPVPPLPPEPRALLGTLLHRLVQWAAETSSPAPDPRAAVEQQFNEMLTRWNAKARTDPDRSRFVPLEETMPFPEFVRRRGIAFNCAERQLAARRSALRPTASSRSRTAAKAGHADDVEPERLLASTSLRLRGKVDAWEQAGGVITIRDYKTGRVHERDEEVLDHIELQMRLYGLLALEVQPRARVRLVVEQEQSHELAFDTAIAEATRRELDSLLAPLPAGATIAADVLARGGAHCLRCEMRHVCPRYRAEAPTSWRVAYDRIPTALDVWGHVEEVPTRDRHGRYEVSIRDAAGRPVRVSSLDDTHGAFEECAGRELWFFGLEPRGTSRTLANEFAHPNNFRERPTGRGERRAWRLAVFQR